ncbi:hypothetical protein HELRODRAFT_159077 [Helobdella robusta]|uniref:RRM domain-containing protein n=1 Tax=Helobdella robusta TaxID=6412 RepID=T1ENK2_HELRO|nr:hypothetical protein HELRODRAFT_159077 [Helobdella robusta]ESO12523.1 hypothetical protein HELRODRAFT_159077 [Helobdella robusta]
MGDTTKCDYEPGCISKFLTRNSASGNHNDHDGGVKSDVVSSLFKKEYQNNADKRILSKPFLKEQKIQNQRTVFVGNVSLNSTKKDLENHFKSCGKIESVRLRSVPIASLEKPKKVLVIKKDFHPKLKTSNAYIVFQDAYSVSEALKLNNMELDGFHLRVDSASSKTHQNKSSIFIGNLRFDADEESLRKFFEVCGEINYVRVVRDKYTRMGKGFAYINFKDSSSVDLALTMDGQEFCNRPLRINRSISKSKKVKKPESSKTLNGAAAKKGYTKGTFKDIRSQNGLEAQVKSRKRKSDSNDFSRPAKIKKNQSNGSLFDSSKTESAKKRKTAKKLKRKAARELKKIKLGELLSKK